MSVISQNLRVGVRGLLKQPSFTVAVVLTLALGIGTTTAMFSVVYGVVLRPLPFGDPDRVVSLWTVFMPAMGRGAVSAANARDWRARNRVLQDLAVIHNNRSFNFVDRGEPERLQGARVSASFFPILRVSPLLGARSSTRRTRSVRTTSSSSATPFGNAASMRTRRSSGERFGSTAFRRPSSVS